LRRRLFKCKVSSTNAEKRETKGENLEREETDFFEWAPAGSQAGVGGADRILASALTLALA
jgi:hypothetical protein